MNRNLVICLFRPWRSFVYTCLCLCWAGLLPVLGKRTSIDIPITAFLGWGFVLPWTIGMTLAAIVHEPMHRPFGALLPGARKRLLRSYGAVAACMALICVMCGFVFDRSLPLPALAALSIAAMTFALPFEPDLRWAGSRSGAIAAIATLLVFVWHSQAMRGFFIAQPWPCAAGCLALAGLNVAVAFSRGRMRARAGMPFTTLLTVYGGPDFAELRKKEDLARRSASRASWRTLTAGASLFTWIRAIRYERNAGWRNVWLPAAIGLLCGALIVRPGLSKGGSYLETLSALVMPSTDARSSPDFILFIATMIWARQYFGPRSDRLYPVSRARRGRMAYAASTWHAILSYGLIVGPVLIVGCGAALKLGQPLEISHVIRLMLKFAVVLPLLPLLQWCMLYAEVRSDRAMQFLAMLLTMLPAFVFQQYAAFWAGLLFTPTGALVFLLLIAGTQWAYYAALRRFYRSGDLIQTGTASRNFGLV